MTCRQCDFCEIHGDILLCARRKADNIMIILNSDKIDIPCHAGEPDTYNLENEYIRPDKETDFGYMEDDWMNDEKYVFRCIRKFN